MREIARLHLDGADAVEGDHWLVFGGRGLGLA